MLPQFCKYNHWANTLLLAALKENASTIPQSSINLFSHILNAQMIWLYRIKGITPNVAVWQVHDLDTCSTLLAESGSGLASIEYPQDETSPVIGYKTSAGRLF